MRIISLLLFMIIFHIKGNSQITEINELLQLGNVRDWTLTPDGNEAFFTIQSIKQNISILVGIKKKGKGWSKPYKLPFSGKFMDLEPYITFDGLRLYFASNRPLSKKDLMPKDFDIWYSDRSCKSCQWSEPVNIGLPINTSGDEFYPSVTKKNNLYFTSTYDYGKGKDDIFFSEFKSGSFLQPTSLSESINTDGYEFNAYVDPEESFMIFSGFSRKDGVGHGDLYISFRNNNEWEQAINLGPPINSTALEYCPFYDQNDQTLYFTSNRSNIEIKDKDNLKTIIAKLDAYENGMSRMYKTKFNLDSLRIHSTALAQKIKHDTNLIDHHVHIMSPTLIRLWKARGIPFSKPDPAYSDIDTIITRLGAKQIKLISMAYVYSSSEFGSKDVNFKQLVEDENNYVAAAKMKYPLDIKAYFGIDPMSDFAMEEIKRCHENLKMFGLKMHFNASQVYLTERKYQIRVKEVLSYASENKIPVLLHFDNSHRKFGMPDLRILSDSILALLPPIELQIAHLGTSGGFNSRTKLFIDSYKELTSDPSHPLNRHKITFDISAVALDKDSEGVQQLDEDNFAELAKYLRQIGMGKLQFGTDYPLYTTQEYMKTLREKVKLSDSEILSLLKNK